jgi:large subunit ribosomal protein L6
MLMKSIGIPDGVSIEFEGDCLVVKGPKGELKRIFRHPKIKVNIKENNIEINLIGPERRKTKALLGTWTAHIKNMISGVLHGWEAKLKIIYLHFPIKFDVKDKDIIIHNFLGERKPRIAKIVGDSKVDIKKDEIIVTGINKEDVGQTAANIETTTRIMRYDRRVFQDGCYIISKCKPIENTTN